MKNNRMGAFIYVSFKKSGKRVGLYARRVFQVDRNNSLGEMPQEVRADTSASDADTIRK